MLLNATTEVRKRTTLQYLDNLKEIATTTPKPPIGFKSSISAGHEAGQLSRPEPQEAARPPKEIEEFVMKVMADFQEKERPKRYVSTGFARTAHPYSAIPKDNPLRPGGEYLFWLKIGKLDPHSIERTPTALPEEGLPPEAKLAIVLFSYPDELELSEAGSLGEVTLHAKGAGTVTRHAYSFPDALKGQGEMEDCVCFPVRCPAKAGKFRLRCCIYHKEVLLQSREVTALVSNDQTSAADCLVSVLDYTINQTLDLRRLAVMSPHRLSILMNGGDGDNPTHQLRFRGQGEFTSGAVIAEAALETLTSTAREAMRLVCWGSRDEWDEHKVYKYENDTLTFETDIITLARAGFRLYSDLIDTLSGGEVSKREIKQLMRHPGLVQLACRRSPRELLPISMIYDHRLDTNLPSRICPAFTDSLLQNTDLAESPCFQGNCPSDGKLDVVCPSGFWGFRHEIGLPVSLTDKKEDESGDVAVTLGSTGGPGLSVAVCLDPQFVLRNTHEKNLRGLDPDLDYCNSRAGTLDMLRTTKSPVVYFYCHGGMQGNYPYIRVGELNEAGISADNLEAYQVNWVPPGPLVFINGCKTTALQPSCAFDFVRAFIQKSHATGVIGTEITIFEPLACAFAESFLRFFVVDNCQVGNSIRRARLSLLRARNPLGLVYIPFALASIQLRARG